MEVNWKDPLQGANLIQEYFLEISENNGSFSVNKSVNRDNQYLIDAHFVPGHLFYAKITSIVYLNDVEKTIYIKSEVLHLVVGMYFLFRFLALNMILIIVPKSSRVSSIKIKYIYY